MLRAILIFCALVIGLAAYFTGPMFYAFWKMASNDPTVYSRDIDVLTAQDAQQSASADAVLFVGHSNIKFWDDLHDHMRPLTVIQRGFGGAKVNDLLYFADRIITPYNVRAIVINIGGNDISSGLGNVPKEPPEVFASYKKLIAHVRARLPDPPIYFLALMEIDDDSDNYRRAVTLNQLIQDFSARGERMFYIDASASVLNSEGRIGPELLRRDGAHLNAEGYARLAVPIRQRLLDDEASWGAPH